MFDHFSVPRPSDRGMIICDFDLLKLLAQVEPSMLQGVELLICRSAVPRHPRWDMAVNGWHRHHGVMEQYAPRGQGGIDSPVPWIRGRFGVLHQHPVLGPVCGGWTTHRT